jgi:RNA polymerase sigma-70 factor (ECF subfamily)
MHLDCRFAFDAGHCSAAPRRISRRAAIRARAPARYGRSPRLGYDRPALPPRSCFVPDPFAAQLDSHRRYLLRVATLQLRDAALAEDVVQDTLVAAIQGEKGFTGKSSLRTWLTGILKHKIIDAIRQKTRSPILAGFEDECRVDDLDALFDDTGHWENPPADWGDPESQLSQQQFIEVMQRCLENLPPNTARVFTMREVMELETDEICAQLTITSNNLWVILHRARLSLRECLEKNWFAVSASPRASAKRNA